MKKLLAMFFAAAVLSACHKDKDIVSNPPPAVKQDPTLKENPAFSSMTMVGAKTDTVIASFYVNPNDATAMTTTGPSSISFIYSGAFKPSTGYKNIYFTVTGPGIAPFTSEIKTNVIDAEDYFNQWSRSFASNTGYLLQIHADVTNLATDGAGADDKCSVVFKLVYQSDGSSVNKTLIDTGQTITFSRMASSTLETGIAQTSPSEQNNVDGQEVSLMDETLTSTGGTNTVTKKVYKFTDPSVSSAVTSVKMYDGASVIGTATPVSGVVIFNSSFTVSTAKTITLKASIGSVDETVSGKSFKLISDKTEYTDAGGTAKVNDFDRVGSDQYVFASLPEFTKGSVPTNAIVNNGQLELYKHSVKFLGGDGSQQQFTYEILLSDANSDDTLTIRDFKLFENGVDVTSQYRITKSAGTIDSVFREADTKIVFTKISGGGETLFPVGVTKTYSLRAKTTGFNNSGAGNNISVRLIGDTNPIPFDYKYVNTGGVNNSNLKLADTNTGSASALFANCIWSDKSRTPHNSGVGNSTKDHYSGAATGKPVFTGLSENYFYD